MFLFTLMSSKNCIYLIIFNQDALKYFLYNCSKYEANY